MNPKTYPPEIKWIFAQRIDGGEWAARGLTSRERPGTIVESNMFDKTPIREMKHSEFGIFNNRAGWEERRPRFYLDLRDKSDSKIYGLEGLINSVQSNLSLSKK